MKIVLIHGQNHKGSTYHMGHIVVDHMTGEKEITEFFLPKDLNHFCAGCYNCIEADETCPFYEEKKRIMDAVMEADVLIFTTPTYCMHASAPMKSFLDMTFTCWMVHRPRKEMFSKRAIVLSTAAGSSTKSATGDIKTALFYWGVPEIYTYGMALQAMGWDDVKPEKKEKLERDLRKLAKKLSATKKPHVGIKTKGMFFIMGRMQAAGWGSSPVEKEYWQKHGWLAGNRPWK